ncbi:MAG: PEP-CTERM sorting domain-containing protein [Planctomycetes bacterium]|nr:PEP-CTERM sorting domain-containing protein [Planctomycetota bacterium]
MNKCVRVGLFACAIGLLTVGSALAHPGGVNAPSPDLPPIIPEGVYLSPQDVHAKYSGPALEVVLSMVEHQPFAALPPRSICDPTGTGGCDEHHEFNSMLHAMVSINGGPLQPIEMQGPVMTVAYGKGPGDTTGTFDTEMLSMSLSGMGGAVMIRESPTRASTGKTSITDIGGGMYHIDSFFDVFTELSLDGGQNWIPKSGLRGTRVNLGGVPEPASVVLLALGLLGFAGVTRRHR